MRPFQIFALMLLFVINACSGYISTQGTDDVVTFESCMSQILRGRDSVDVNPSISFVSSVAHDIFSCENFRGEAIKFYGKKIRTNGTPLYSGYGYAVADRRSVVKDLLLSANLELNYRDSSGDFKFFVEQNPTYISDYDIGIRTYTIIGQYKSIKQSIGAVSIVDFSHDGLEYTGFFWVHGLGLTQEKIVYRMRKLLPFILPLPKRKIA
jgi:hypothetical protein